MKSNQIKTIVITSYDRSEIIKVQFVWVGENKDKLTFYGSMHFNISI